jgi:hypothetical protein
VCLRSRRGRRGLVVNFEATELREEARGDGGSRRYTLCLLAKVPLRILAEEILFYARAFTLLRDRTPEADLRSTAGRAKLMLMAASA